MKTRRFNVSILTLILALGAVRATWGQDPRSNDTSDNEGNTGGGFLSMEGITSGKFNTAYGAAALKVNSAGTNNTAVGESSLIANTTGNGNTAVGADSLSSNTLGSHNTAVGDEVLVTNTQGTNNTAVGELAMFWNNGGSDHTVVGSEAAFNNRTGHNNTVLGYRALYSNVSGTTNLALGWNAGYYSTGDNNIYLANYGAAGESNTIRIGQSQTHTFISGVAGNAISGTEVVVNSEGRLGILGSSVRYKDDIQPMGERSQGLLHLCPVTFRYKQDEQHILQYGLIAEEVASVFPELVVRGPDGQVESLQYHELIPMLLNELQAQARQVSELKEQNDGLQSADQKELAGLRKQNEEQRAQLSSLAARLQRLEAQSAGIPTETNQQ
jgi:Chaperone of endosialidase